MGSAWWPMSWASGPEMDVGGTTVADMQAPEAASTGVARASISDLPALLRAHIARQLPQYMVPEQVQLLERLPLTPNGKLDERALLALPDLAARARSYRPPRDSLETMLVEIWSDLLEVEPMGLDDNFFELGGHSLLAMRLVARIRATLGVSVPVRNVFAHPTVAELRQTLTLPGTDMANDVSRSPRGAARVVPPCLVIRSAAAVVLA